MPTLTVTKGWSTGATLTEAHLDGIKTSIETLLNTTKIDGDNIQTAGLAAENYAAGSVNAAALASDSVTTAKIADGAVTLAKRAAVNSQLSSSSSTFSTTSTSFTDATNLSCTITTTGRPVRAILVSDGSSDAASVGSSTSVTTFDNDTLQTQVKLVRDSTDVQIQALGNVITDPISHYVNVPSSAFVFFDTPSAGTYTYKIQVKSSTSNVTSSISYTKLLVMEL